MQTDPGRVGKAPPRLTPIRHMLRVIDEILAVNHALTALKHGVPIEQASVNAVVQQLYFQCSNLEELCRKPANFEPQTFDDVNLLRSKLVYFIEKLRKDPLAAMEYWHDNGERAVDIACEAVKGEIDKVFNSLREEASLVDRIAPDP